MPNAVNETELRVLFSYIIRGFTIAQNSKFGKLFLKHLSSIDVAEIDDIYNFHYEDATKNNNAPTRQQQEEYIIKEGLWPKDNDIEISQYKKMLSDFENNYSKEYLKSRRKTWLNEIESCKRKLREFEAKKAVLLGLTAETYATKKANEEHIKKSFYKDNELKQLLFNTAQFDELDEETILQLNNIHNEYSDKFNSENLKKIALCPFFLNMFYLCADNPYNFYGKPIVYLTFYQSQLFSFGRHFKNILSDHGNNIPAHILNDPNELIEWTEINKNFKEIDKGEANEETSGTSIIGATKADLEYLGITPQQKFSTTKELEKKGGHLDMRDLMDLHGEN